jgi:murein hydrolase activator
LSILFNMSFFRLISALSLQALVATGAFAQQATEQDLQAVEQDIVLSAEKQKQLDADAKAAVEAQSVLSGRLVSIAETVAEQERKLAKAEKRQKKLRDEIAVINLSLVERQDAMAEVLAGLQRLEHNPPPALVVAPDDVLGALRGAMVMGSIVPELRRSAQELHDQLAALKGLREKFEAEGRQVNDALVALETSRAEVNQLIEDKKALAALSKQQLADERKRAEELAERATSLKELLAKLEEERKAAEAKRTAEEKARAEAEKKAKDALIKPTVMAMAQGQLRYPAEGQVIKGFGSDTGLGTRLDGIVIATVAKAQITSPVAGKVEFAGKFRSYGQMVIVNPGDGYLVLLAGLSDIQASFGQSVNVGEPVGLMGEKPGKLAVSNGLTDLTTPVLYVEFRKNGNPVDPTPWWIGQRQEAMR